MPLIRVKLDFEMDVPGDVIPDWVATGSLMYRLGVQQYLNENPSAGPVTFKKGKYELAVLTGPHAIHRGRRSKGVCRCTMCREATG